LTQECINDGGPPSLIRLSREPVLEKEQVLEGQAGTSLLLWKCPPGAILSVMAPDGTYFRARIAHLKPSPVIIPFQRVARPLESPIQIDIFHALPEKERFELVLEKITEIGVSRIVPFTSKRSTTLGERDAKQKKSHRWPDIVRKAALQCRRPVLPELYPVLDWSQALTLAEGADLRLILFEKDAPWTLKEILERESPQRISVMIGPEGGFDPEEIDSARSSGFLPVTLGGRLLRTETAAILGAALIQYHCGDLG